jgi:hypothetical protein
MVATIRYVKSSEVDFDKWDQCVENAGNGSIYACSFYLNHMCSHWDALILDDYKALMPLPWRKKIGISYLYQPFLTAQLGLIGDDIDAALLEKFLMSIPATFKYWDITLNKNNVFNLISFPLFLRSNFTLSLNKPYTELYAQYKQTTKRNVKKSVNHVSSIIKDVDIEDIITLNKKSALEKKGITKEDDYQKFRKLFHFLKVQKKAVSYGALSKSNTLLASAVFFLFKNKAYYILVGNSTESKATSASHRIIDVFIQEHAGENMVLDFEGSDIKSLAFFYRSFGAQEEKYAALRYNKLPRLIRWLKP